MSNHAESQPRPRWMTLKEAAQYYRLQVDTFRQWRLRGKLSEEQGWHKLNGAVRINTDEFERAFMDGGGSISVPARKRRRKATLRKVRASGGGGRIFRPRK